MKKLILSILLLVFSVLVAQDNLTLYGEKLAKEFGIKEFGIKTIFLYYKKSIKY